MTQGGREDDPAGRADATSSSNSRETDAGCAKTEARIDSQPSSSSSSSCIAEFSPGTAETDSLLRDTDITQPKHNNSGEDVKSLLNFVSVATTDIKAALDKSAPCKRSVDHRKYLQRQLKRFSGSPISPTSVYHQQHHPSASDNCHAAAAAITSHFTAQSRPAALNSNSPSRKDFWHPCRPDQLTSASSRMSTDSLSDGHIADGHVFESDRLFENFKSDDTNNGGGEGGKTSCVPLRQRQLPASFWKEPNKPKSSQDPLANITEAQKGSVAMNNYDYNTKDLTCDVYRRHWFNSNLHLEAKDTLHADYIRKCTSDYPLPLTYAWNYSLLHPDGKTKQTDSSRTLRNTTANTSVLSAHAYSVGPFISNSFGGYRTLDSTNLCFPQPLYPNNNNNSFSSTHRAPIWRPIPTKTITAFPTRYHPFADVH